MTGRKSDFTLPTNTLDDLFSTQEERDDAKLSKIRDIPLELIDDFPDHPFKVRDDEDTLKARSFKGRQAISVICVGTSAQAAISFIPLGLIPDRNGKAMSSSGTWMM